MNRKEAEAILAKHWHPLAVAPNPETLESIYAAILEASEISGKGTKEASIDGDRETGEDGAFRF